MCPRTGCHARTHRTSLGSQVTVPSRRAEFVCFFPVFSHRLGSPEWFLMSIFPCILSNMSSILKALHFPYIFYKSLSNCFFCLPLRLFPGSSVFTIPRSTCPPSLLVACLYQPFLCDLHMLSLYILEMQARWILCGLSTNILYIYFIILT